MISRTCFIAFLFLIGACDCYSQVKTTRFTNRYSTQLGFSLKGTLEIGSRNHPNPVYRFAAAAGVGSDFLNSWLYPSFNLELQFYNGGPGSKSEKKFLRENGFLPGDLDIVAAFTMTVGKENYFDSQDQPSLSGRQIPLYYFADFVYPPLQNPFRKSLSLGTNLIFTPFNSDKKNQRIGFINGHCEKFQLSYWNDGGPLIYKPYVGDRKDRYYTGGAVISYHGRSGDLPDLIELSYHKFTGYTKNAFEVSNKLYLIYMDYKQEVQQKYNKSVLTLNLGNVNKGWGIHVRSYNALQLDFQHMIHTSRFNAYHMVPYKPHISVGINYYNSQSKIGIK